MTSHPVHYHSIGTSSSNCIFVAKLSTWWHLLQNISISNVISSTVMVNGSLQLPQQAVFKLRERLRYNFSQVTSNLLSPFQKTYLYTI